MKPDSLYDPKFVRGLFDEMAETYGIVNLLSSFGFTIWWRRCLARTLSIEPSATVLDLMTGMGELCCEINKALNADGKLLALDNSPVMCRRAEMLELGPHYHVLEADALAMPLENDSVDYVFSTFGLKTFDHQQLKQLASEVNRVLRPGGEFAFLEVSVPPSPLLRIPYMFYLRSIVPLLGKLFLGNPDNYRMLGVYTQAFGNCTTVADLFAESGFETSLRSYFFGCATGVVGCKPVEGDLSPSYI